MLKRAGRDACVGARLFFFFFFFLLLLLLLVRLISTKRGCQPEASAECKCCREEDRWVEAVFEDAEDAVEHCSLYLIRRSGEGVQPRRVEEDPQFCRVAARERVGMASKVVRPHLDLVRKSAEKVICDESARLSQPAWVSRRAGA